MAFSKSNNTSGDNLRCSQLKINVSDKLHGSSEIIVEEIDTIPNYSLDDKDKDSMHFVTYNGKDFVNQQNRNSIQESS